MTHKKSQGTVSVYKYMRRREDGISDGGIIGPLPERRRVSLAGVTRRVTVAPS